MKQEYIILLMWIKDDNQQLKIMKYQISGYHVEYFYWYTVKDLNTYKMKIIGCFEHSKSWKYGSINFWSRNT